MNPSNAPPLPASNFYREQDKKYKCPAHGCSISCEAPESLQHHISFAHTFREHPNGAVPPNNIPFTTGHVNSAGSPHAPIVLPSTLLNVSQPMHHTQPQRNTQNVSHPPPRSTQTPPNNGQMLPPANAPPLSAGGGIQIQVQPSSWIETTGWPERTEIFLKQLAHKYELYANPTNKEEQGTLCALFDEFYDKTDFRTWKPPKHDERLWQLFRMKLDQIQTEMLLQGETIRTSDGSIKRVYTTAPKVVTIISTPESLATPPATPDLASNTYSDGVELWNGLDVDGQAALFRQQLRSAKNRKGLMLEWNEYCGEIKKKKKLRNKSRDPKSSTPSTRSASLEILTAAPVPIRPRAEKLDVKGIIAKRIKELEMKRVSDDLQADEERAAKRPKVDPA